MELEDLRVDDLPLIYSMLEVLGIQEAIDKNVKCHGRWLGPSPGTITSLWICYILSECDHRLSAVESWAEQRILLLQAMIKDNSLSSKDFSDDRLATILDYLSADENWLGIEADVNKKGLSIYRLKSPKHIPTLRLDSAPMQSHGKIKEGGLLQYGYSKHHNGNLGQFKIQLCSLDNEINHFGFPISQITVSGEQADDTLYLPIISQVRKQLCVQGGYEKENLYVGDGKMGSKAIRGTISKNEDYYLVPLSKLQLSVAKRLAYIEQVEKRNYQKVEKKEHPDSEKETTKVVAQGFEALVDHSCILEGRLHEWEERYLFVQSEYYKQQQEVKLDNHLERSITLLRDLPISRKGKKVLHSLEEMENASDKILTDNKLKGLLRVTVKQTKHVKSIRAYGTRPAREEEYYTYELHIERQEDKITERKKLMGWQVFATNVPKEKLSFEQCVWKYRYQSNIERQFDNIRNKVVKLLPVYLNKDNRIIGLVNLLMLALKTCCLTEYNVARALKKQNDELADIYEGNPKRTSKKPSAKRLFKAFEGISIALVFQDKILKHTLLTKLEPVQRKILRLLDLDENLYEHLRANIQIFFTHSNYIET